MDKKQKINCTVDSCTFNDHDSQECELDQIIVEPSSSEFGTGDPEDESMCGSYTPDDDNME